MLVGHTICVVCEFVVLQDYFTECVLLCSNPDVMMEAYNRGDASPIFFMVYIIITLYFITNIVSTGFM